MNLTCGLRCLSAFLDCPGTTFILTCCQEANQSQKAVACSHQFVKTAGGNTKVFQVFLLLIIIQVSQFLFNLCTDNKNFSTFFPGHFSDFGNVWIGSTVISQVILSYVSCIDGWLCSQKIVILEPNLFIFIIGYFKCSCHLAVFKMCLNSLSQFKLLGISLVHLGLFGNLGNSSLQNLNIGEDKFQIDGFNISCRVNRTVYMDNVVIFKAANNMDNSIHFTDVGKKLVAETFTFAGTLYKTCNIYKFNGSRSYFFRMIEFTELHNSFIRNSNDTYVRVNSCKWIVGRQGTGLCQRVE